MAQHDYDLANQAGAAFRADLNNALLAAVTQNNGATEPATKFAYMPWPDTTSGIFKIRNAANTAWISLFALSNGDWVASLATAFASPTFTGNPSAPSPARFDNDTSLATSYSVNQAAALAVSNITGNILPNGSAEFGAHDWSLGSGVVPQIGSFSECTYFGMPSVTAQTLVSLHARFIPLNQGLSFYLQAEFYSGGITAGTINCDVEYYNSSFASLGFSTRITAVNGQVWTRHSINLTSPANTAYIKVRFFFESATSTNAAIRRIKISQENTAYSSATRDVIGTTGNFSGLISAEAGILSSSPTAGIGYTTGAGGSVTQITSINTGVTINKITGIINTVSHAVVSGTANSFTVTNSAFSATDSVVVGYVNDDALVASEMLFTYAQVNGSFKIGLRGLGTTTIAPIIKFTIIKAVNA
jgi:hypothetical protein